MNQPILLRLFILAFLILLGFLTSEWIVWRGTDAVIQYYHNGKPCKGWNLLIVGRGSWPLDNEGKVVFHDPVPKGAWLSQLSNGSESLMYVERGVPRGKTVVKFEDGRSLSQTSYEGIIFSKNTFFEFSKVSEKR